MEGREPMIVRATGPPPPKDHLPTMPTMTLQTCIYTGLIYSTPLSRTSPLGHRFKPRLSTSRILLAMVTTVPFADIQVPVPGFGSVPLVAF